MVSWGGHNIWSWTSERDTGTDRCYHCYRPDGGAYQKEKAAIDAADPTSFGDTLYGITVGSEGMYRGTYNAQELVGWIGEVQKSYPNTHIGTADSWNCWANGTMDSIITSGISLMYD